MIIIKTITKRFIKNGFLCDKKRGFKYLFKKRCSGLVNAAIKGNTEPTLNISKNAVKIIKKRSNTNCFRLLFEMCFHNMSKSVILETLDKNLIP